MTRLMTAAVVAALNAAAAATSDADELAIETRIRTLEQELQLLREAVQAQHAQADGAAQPTVPDRAAAVPGAGEKGFSLASSDGAFKLRLRSLVQADGRFYFDEGDGDRDTFLVRRARLELTGTVSEQFDFRLMEDFAGSSSTLLDAWLDWKISPQFQVLAGKVKMPISLERVQSREHNLTAEFGYPTLLAPNRAVGLAVHGELAGSALDYFLGAYNWTPDGASSLTSASGDLNLVARLFARPFVHTDTTALQGLGFGIAGSHGDGAGSPSNYLSVGQQPFYRWRSGVMVDGETWRLAPQAWYFKGPFGLLGEYAVSSQTVSNGAARAELQNAAWQLTAAWMLTGENATFNGVGPLETVNFGDASHWGAWQLVLRATELQVDDAAFPVYADPALSASRSTTYGVGVNWYLSSMLRFTLNYDWSRFRDAELEDEHALISRLQFRY